VRGYVDALKERGSQEPFRRTASRSC
jgi:hypothetical protein